jgi:hypothetical protein
VKRARRREAAAVAILIAAAALIRLPCLRTDLWFDEVWSLGFARHAQSLWEVFVLRHDNSHLLNTLWLYLVAGSSDFAVFRLFSFACGLLTVAALAQDPEDPPRGLLTGTLAAASAVMTLYSTEARGYAPMALCAVLCYRLLPPPGPLRRRRAAAFSLCAALGFFAHGTFVFVFAGLGAWALARYPRQELMRKLLALFAPPLAVLVLHAALRGGVIIGGGVEVPFSVVAARTFILWSGAPDAGFGVILGTAALTALCVIELGRLRKRGDAEFWFHAVLLVSAVAFSLVFPFRAERYLFAGLPFALILSARTLLRMLRGGIGPRLAAVFLIAAFLGGNAARVRALAVDGRGHYLDAMKRMAAETPGGVVTWGSDHRARNPMLADFYAPYVVPPKSFVYVGADRLASDPPDWYVRHSFETDPRSAPLALTLSPTAAYRLVHVYPYSGMSGWSWQLYRRERAPGAPST